jgi:hypothetical protein
VEFPLIGFYLGTVNLSLASDLVSSSAVTTILGLLTIVGAPISLIIGALGLLRRRFAWISGIFAMTIGIGWTAILSVKVGLGSFIFVFGAIVVLSALILPKKLKTVKS